MEGFLSSLEMAGEIRVKTREGGTMKSSRTAARSIGKKGTSYYSTRTLLECTYLDAFGTST